MSVVRKYLPLFSLMIFPLLTAGFVLIYLNDPLRYVGLLQEDRLVEWIATLFLLAGGLLALEVAWQIHQREHTVHWFFWLVGVLLVLAFLEEISWGQRLLNVESPEYFLSNSDQQEINVHNVLQQKLNFKTKDLLGLAFFSYGVILPLLGLNRRIRALLDRVRLVTPPLYLLPGFLLATLMTFDVPTNFEEEIGELFFALGLVILMLHQLLLRNPIHFQPVRLPAWMALLSTATFDRLSVAALTLLSLGLHLWYIAAKGLWLGEAANAMAARAPIAEILNRHWLEFADQAPLWPILLRAWTALAGQSPTALRAWPAFAAAAAVPLTWRLLKEEWKNESGVRLLATLLIAISPALVLYGQDNTPYAAVIGLALLSLLICVRVAGAAPPRLAALLVGANWILTYLHFFAAFVILAEAIYLAVYAVRNGITESRAWRTLGLTVLLSSLPLALWLLLAPGLQPMIGQNAAVDPVAWWETLSRLLKDLLYGSVGRQGSQAAIAFILVPLLIVGIIALLRIMRRPQTDSGPQTDGRPETEVPFAWMLLFVFALPILAVTIAFSANNSGAVAYALPPLLIITALGVIRIGAQLRLIGAACILLVLLVSGVAVNDYFANYTKSEYAGMSADLAPRLSAEDGLLLSAPQQHLLTKYYLGPDRDLLPIPQLTLPDHWPVQSEALVPEDVDSAIQDYLRQYAVLWLLQYDEKSTDPYAFLPQYLTAVTFKESCAEWLDAEYCRYYSPVGIEPELSSNWNALYNGQLRLISSDIAATERQPDGSVALLSRLNWETSERPAIDYKISLRLTDPGGTVIDQRDDFPIGSLLPPTTWAAGDAKPGFMALTINPTLPPGRYAIDMAVYDPNTLETSPFMVGEAGPYDQRLELASVIVDADGIVTIDAVTAGASAANELTWSRP